MDIICYSDICDAPREGTGVILTRVSATGYRFSCQSGLVPGMVPAGTMIICKQGRWSPDPGDLMCALNDCGDPQLANGVVTGNYSSTLAGSNVIFQCAAGLVPTGVETAVCGNDGRWTPDPANHGCGNASTGMYHVNMVHVHVLCSCWIHVILAVNCTAPSPPADGSIDPYTSTVQGAKLTFRCDEGFSPSGRMTAVCQASGNWEPDPASTLCSNSGYIIVAITIS